jgi:hypothetical protein
MDILSGDGAGVIRDHGDGWRWWDGGRGGDEQ